MNARTSRWTRSTRNLALAVSTPVLLAALAGCSLLPGGTVEVSGTAGPAGVSTDPSASASAGSPSSSSPSGSSGSGQTTSPTGTTSGGSGGSGGSGSSKGCPAGGTTIPKSANKGKTADLDGDGRADTLWLYSLGLDRRLGVRTASGAGFSVSYSSSSPRSATAIGARVQGGSIILLDFGREARLYSVVGCRIVPTVNQQGDQYTFDEGFTGYGSGTGCVSIGGATRLVGYLAKPDSKGERFNVTRTTVTLSENGRRAKNGATVNLGTNLAYNSKIVLSAQGITCGSAKGVNEPAS